jgi:hypothetical protein
MKALMPGLVALVILSGFSTSAQAQRFVGGFGNGGVAISPGIGVTSGYYGGYGNYGGYGRGYYSNPYYNYNVPQTYNNMGGLMNTIRQQTGKPGSYRYSSNYGVTRTRRGR